MSVTVVTKRHLDGSRIGSVLVLRTSSKRPARSSSVAAAIATCIYRRVVKKTKRMGHLDAQTFTNTSGVVLDLERLFK